MTQNATFALVTGATGFVGGRLVERLLYAGWRVRVLVRAPERLTESVKSDCEIIKGDLADVDVLYRAVLGVGVVFHCAANVRTWDSWQNYEADNVDGVRNLLAAIDRAGGLPNGRLVHVSTVDVYGFPEIPCDERCIADGGEFRYGKSKWLGESLVRRECDQKSIPYTILRPANVIGPGSQFIERIGAELKSGLMLVIDGGRANAGLIYIDNLADYLIWAATARIAIGQCYNVRDPYDVTWHEFMQVMRQGLAGKGIVLNMPFFLANFLGSLLEWTYILLQIQREPLIHRLIVRLFGRTCGHSAAKIQCDSGMVGAVGFNDAMKRSIAWFRSK